jgi:PAS domain S-box-containing protein
MLNSKPQRILDYTRRQKSFTWSAVAFPMNWLRLHRTESRLERVPRRVWHLASSVLAVTSALLLLAVLVANFQRSYVVTLLSVAFAASIFALVFLLAGFSRQLRRHQRETASELETTAGEFAQMADNIQEIFWTIDARTQKVIYVNQAYQMITGRSLQSLRETPSSYKQLIHPDDRCHILGKLDEAIRSGRFDEKFRIVRPEGEVRWIWMRGFPVRSADGAIIRLVGTALEITTEKEAEARVAENLALAKSAWAEAEALHKATMGLTQDLRMDFVLDALLQSLSDLIPYTCARVLIPEGGPHVLALGEKRFPIDANLLSESPMTLNADRSAFLKRILTNQESVLIPDTAKEVSWATFEGHTELRSWLSVPLLASGQYLGFLSVGHTEADRFTEDHLRRAQLLAIPAAAAIQNSRLYERAAIYGEELERRVKDLSETQAALLLSEEARRISDERFQKVFRSSPIPFSITTLADGRFLEVNGAFEQRYGYVRKELVGHTVHELRIWEDPHDRTLMISRLQHGPVRNVITRLRMKSGEIRVTVYSADRFQFDGQRCVLAVSDDVLENSRPSN